MREYDEALVSEAWRLRGELDEAILAARAAGARPGDGSAEDLRACAAQAAWQEAVIAANRDADERAERAAFDALPVC